MTERLKEAKMPSGHEIERGRRKRMRERERDRGNDDRLCCMLGKERQAVTSASVVRWYEADKGPRLTLSRSPFQKTFYKKEKKRRLAFLSSHSRLTGTTMSRQMKSRKREREREGRRGRQTEASHFWFCWPHCVKKAGLQESEKEGKDGRQKGGVIFRE